jgi:hypothetical protein
MTRCRPIGALEDRFIFSISFLVRFKQFPPAIFKVKILLGQRDRINRGQFLFCPDNGTEVIRHEQPAIAVQDTCRTVSDPASLALAAIEQPGIGGDLDDVAYFEFRF